MKGFIVVDRLNDIQFIDTDKELARHINGQAKESGLLPEDYDDMYTVDTNIVMQLFSPLIMSQWFMIDHSRNPCSSITCENDFLFVFKHFEDYLAISINGDGTETEDFLVRKSLIFIRLVGFVMGPVIEEIGKPRFTSKIERWNYLRLLLSTWTYLAQNEQSFLVEAVEKLHMNQVVSEQCVEVLQAAIARIQEVGEKYTQHALLLVNSKLLSVYSHRSAHELQSVDILCTILLVRSLFPTHVRLEDFFAQSYRPVTTESSREEESSPRERYESAVEGGFTTNDEADTDVEQYFSAFENRKSRGEDSSSSLQDDNNSQERNSGDASKHISGKERVYSFFEDFVQNYGERETPYPEVSERFFTPVSSPILPEDPKSKPYRAEPMRFTVGVPVFDKKTRPRSHTSGEIEAFITKQGGSMAESKGRGRSQSLVDKKDTVLCSGKSSSETNLATPTREESSQKEELDFIKQTVFLATPICKHSPYQIHCKKIYPGITLVVLTEMPKLSQAPSLVQLLQLLKDLLNDRKDMISRSQGHLIYDVINSQLAKVLVSLKKAKGHLQKLCRDIKKKWESEEFRGNLMSYLEQGTHNDLSPSLERALRTLQGKLMELFLYLYLSPRPATESLKQALTVIRGHFVKQLGDYRDYLSVKAQRNITMTTYIEDFPGLVHFIYVNRRTNQLMAPSLNIVTGEDGITHDATQLLKDKIWGMMSWMQQKLHAGYTSVTVREGDYHYSYFLWFENLSGDPEVIQKAYKADSTAPPPGILTGNFYKYVTAKCFPHAVPNSVYCNELFMMHVGLANTHYIATHCRQLAAKLYETSGEVLSNITLNIL